MASRHIGRVIALQTLFQSSSRESDSFDDISSDYLNTLTYDDTTKGWGKELSAGVWTKKSKLDALIKEFSISWSIDRISLVDLNILRIGFYELLFTDVPARIVVNEAVELAKEYSSDDSPKFVNGLLGKYVEKHVHGDH